MTVYVDFLLNMYVTLNNLQWNAANQQENFASIIMCNNYTEYEATDLRKDHLLLNN